MELSVAEAVAASRSAIPSEVGKEFCKNAEEELSQPESTRSIQHPPPHTVVFTGRGRTGYCGTWTLKS